VRVTVAVVLLMAACFSGVAAADHDENDDDEDDGDTVIEIDLDEVVEGIEGLSDDFGDFVSNFDEEVKDAVIEAVFMPFKRVAEYLIGLY